MASSGHIGRTRCLLYRASSSQVRGVGDLKWPRREGALPVAAHTLEELVLVAA